MRHRRKSKHFSRKTTAWKALFRGLIISMVEHGRIATTVEKAKELRRHVEKAITLGKDNDLAARRLLLSRIPNKDTVNSIITDIAPRFKNRNGGYTRIIKIGRRPGDTAEMAFIEFVDYDWKTATNGKSSDATDADEKSNTTKDVKDKSADKTKVEAKKAKVTSSKAKTKAVIAKKKTSAKKQKKARAAARV